MNQELRKFIDKEVKSLEKKYQHVQEQYGYTGSPSSYKTMERYQLLLTALEKARIGISESEHGYEIFNRNMKGIVGAAEKMAGTLEPSKAIDEILKMLRQQNYFSAKEGRYL